MIHAQHALAAARAVMGASGPSSWALFTLGQVRREKTRFDTANIARIGKTGAVVVEQDLKQNVKANTNAQCGPVTGQIEQEDVCRREDKGVDKGDEEKGNPHQGRLGRLANGDEQ